jgi:hypothetical protein
METLKKLSTDTDVLLDAFQLEKVYGGQLIDNWVKSTSELTPNQKALLEDTYLHSFKRSADGMKKK